MNAQGNRLGRIVAMGIGQRRVGGPVSSVFEVM